MTLCHQSLYQRFRYAGIATLFLIMVGMSGYSPVYAQGINVAVTLTADNAYQVCQGNSTTVTSCAGTDADWRNTESYTLTGLDPATDFVYIAAWSDDSSYQGLLLQVTGQLTVLSGNPAIQVFGTGENLDIGDPAPTLANMTGYLATANWVAPATGWTNASTAPWRAMPAIDSSAQWIWFDSGTQPTTDPRPPFEEGFDHAEYLIFRIPVSALVLNEQPDLMITKSSQPTIFETGTNAQYILDITNIGNGPTTDAIVVADTIPTGLTPLNVTVSPASGWSCLITGQDVQCTSTDPLTQAAAFVQIVIEVAVTDQALPFVANCATIKTSNELSYANNESCIENEVIPGKPADLTIKKSAEPTTFVAGAIVNYLLTVTNVGAGPTVGQSWVGDTLPAGLIPLNVTVTPAGNWNCTILGQNVQCVTNTPINAGQSYTFVIQAKVNPKVAGPVKNCASVKGGNESDYTNNESCIETAIVQPQPEVTADLGDAPDSSNHFALSMTAYPFVLLNVAASGAYDGTGVFANFPTVFAGDPIPGPYHWLPKKDAWLGKAVSCENDADLTPDCDNNLTNLDPTNDKANRDQFDDGVHLTTVQLPKCGVTAFRYDVTVVGGLLNRFVNGWFDLNRDGDWSDSFTCTQPNGKLLKVSEWAVRNQVISYGNGYHTVTTPNFNTANTTPDKPMWMRITLGELKATTLPGSPYADGRGPAGGYKLGETEDYLLNSSAVAITNSANDQGDAAVVRQEIPFAQIANDDQTAAGDEHNEEENTQSVKIYLPVIVH